METGKKTGLYGLGPLDRSPVWSLENWDRTIWSSLKPDCKSGNRNSEQFGAYELDWPDRTGLICKQSGPEF